MQTNENALPTMKTGSAIAIARVKKHPTPISNSVYVALLTRTLRPYFSASRN